MATFLATLTPMLTLFFCIAIGFALTKSKVLPESASKTMAKMETWIFCPALSFMTNARYFTVDTISRHGVNIMIGVIATTISLAIAIPLSGLFAKKNTAERGIYSYALAIANFGYMGDPIVMALFGEEMLSYYKIFCLPLTVAIYTWGINELIPKDKERGSAVKRFFNPPTIALFVGIVFGLTGFTDYIPKFLVSSMDSLKACMGPVAMLLAGVTIAQYDFLSMLKKKKVYIATALRLVAIPAVLIATLCGVKVLFNTFLGLPIGNEVLFFAFFSAATPLGLNTVVFPAAYGGNPETGASMAMISHTLCVVSMPLMYSLMVAVFGLPFGG